MRTPLQERSYELTLRAASIRLTSPNSAAAAELHRRLFATASDLGAWTERAAGAPSRDVFRTCLYEVNTHVRIVKLWVGLLDDLGAVEPEAASPLHDLAEEVHRLVLGAIRTVRDTPPVEVRNGHTPVG